MPCAPQVTSFSYLDSYCVGIDRYYCGKNEFWLPARPWDAQKSFPNSLFALMLLPQGTSG